MLHSFLVDFSSYLLPLFLLTSLHLCEPSGVLFIEDRPLILGPSHYIFHLDFGISNVTSALAQIRLQISGFSTLQEKLLPNLNAPDPLNIRSIVIEYNHSLHYRFEYLQGELSKFQTPARKARAVFAPLGDLLHWFAGTARVSDLQQFEGSLQELATKSENQFGLFYTYLSNASLTLQRHDEMLSRTRQSLEILSNSTEATFRHLESEIREIEVASSVYYPLTSTYMALQRHLSELQREIERIALGIRTAEAGRLTPDVLPEGVFRRALERAQTSLPREMDFVTFHSRNPLAIYNFAETRVLRTREGPQVAIIFPLARRNSTFLLYRPHPFPTNTDRANRTIVLQTNGMNLAKSADGSRFLVLPNHFERSCTERHGVLLCSPDFPSFDRDANFCLIAAFLNISQGIHRFCDFQLVVPPFTVFLRGHTPDSWHFSLSHPTPVTVSCPTKIETILLQAQGVLTLPPLCSATGEHWSLPPTPATIQATVTVPENTTIEALPFYNLSDFHHDLIDYANASGQLHGLLQSLYRLDTHQVISFPLSKIRQHLLLLDKTEHQVSVLQISGLSTSSVVILAIIAIIIYLRCARRATKTPEQENPPQSPQSNINTISIYNNSRSETVPMYTELLPL